MKKLLLLLVVIFMVFGVTRTAHEPPKQPHKWGVEYSKAYARDVMLAWTDKQFVCLDKLWQKESNWRPEAYNKVNQVTEASTNDGADNMLMRAQKLIESNPNLNNITIQTHNGNIELPIMEMWVQDGVLKISVNHSSLQNSMNGVN